VFFNFLQYFLYVRLDLSAMFTEVDVGFKLLPQGYIEQEKHRIIGRTLKLRKATSIALLYPAILFSSLLGINKERKKRMIVRFSAYSEAYFLTSASVLSTKLWDLTS